ncbi:SubName: Full=Uncharacterized protein {ECO:0000313/EMBL:CCA67424.1} [Serendipita indica DSM 11827]|nr:SubName: Full=Uncharacterized protein {ECO:0000313/EMBL:CCA67424.1} [Serendipita indica DSM 11827]
MFTVGLLLSLLLFKPLATLACSVTVSSTTIYTYATPATTQRPTPTPTSRTTATCVAGVCESTGCVSSTVMVSYFVCEDHCLARWTSTSTFTSYVPVATSTVVCGAKYHPRDYLFGDDAMLDKRSSYVLFRSCFFNP